MYSIEEVKAAQLCISELVKNPITKTQLDSNSAFNDTSICRLLFVALEVLDDVISNGGVTAKRGHFTFTSEEQMKLSPLPDPQTITQFADYINTLLNRTDNKLSHSRLGKNLEEKGFLYKIQAYEDNPSRNIRVPTEAGAYIGISVKERNTECGIRKVTLYSSEAQQFIIDNLEELSQKHIPENHEKPWTREMDDHLSAQYKNGKSIYELASEMKRSHGAIRSRLAHKGLI